MPQECRRSSVSSIRLIGRIELENLRMDIGSRVLWAERSPDRLTTQAFWRGRGFCVSAARDLGTLLDTGISFRLR